MRILFADNDPFFRATRAAYLERAGHFVLHASTPAEAEELLRGTYIHVAVMDIRLVDDDDDADVSGLKLVTHPGFRRIAKVVLTGFDSSRYVREALLADAEGRPGAWDYLVKGEPPERLVEVVEKVGRERLHIDRALRIHSDPRALLSLSNLAGLLAPEIQSDLAGEQSPEVYAGELEDLFRWVFASYEQVTLQQLLWRRDRRFALLALAYAPKGQAAQDNQYIVTCGPAEAMRAEAEVYRRSVPAALEPDRDNALKTAATLHFGMNAYDVPDGGLEDARKLSDYYGEANARQVGEAFDAVCKGPLTAWHARTQAEAPADLAALIEGLLPLPRAEVAALLQPRLAAIGKQAHDLGLGDLQVIDGDMLLTPARLKQNVLPNPARCLTGAGLLSAERSVSYSTLIRALDGETVLVGPLGRTWITDYACLAPGPLVADYAALEAAVKFDLEDCADALERYEFEKALVSANQLGARLDPSVPPLEKALAAVRRVRQLAGEACGPDIQPYFAALFVCTLERVLQVDPAIRRTRKEVAGLLHAAISLGLICQRLISTDTPQGRGRGLRLVAKERCAVVDGGVVPLTPNEYEFLHYLWEHRDGVCDREAVSGAVFRDVPAKTDPTRLNVLVTRLRSKIEPDPVNPVYLVTVRGHGFRLVPDGLPPSAAES